jgi:hypothetical protein
MGAGCKKKVDRGEDDGIEVTVQTFKNRHSIVVRTVHRKKMYCGTVVRYGG